MRLHLHLLFFFDIFIIFDTKNEVAKFPAVTSTLICSGTFHISFIVPLLREGEQLSVLDDVLLVSPLSLVQTGPECCPYKLQ